MCSCIFKNTLFSAQIIYDLQFHLKAATEQTTVGRFADPGKHQRNAFSKYFHAKIKHANYLNVFHNCSL